MTTRSHHDRGVSTGVTIAIAGVALAGIVAAWVIWQHRAASPAAARSGPETPLGPDERAYLASIRAGDFHMSAADNFLGGTETYLDGNVSNTGKRQVRRLDLELTFVDYFGQVVLRETVHPVTGSSRPLDPGETRPFRVTFEHLPAEWNQAAPAARAVYLRF